MGKALPEPGHAVTSHRAPLFGWQDGTDIESAISRFVLSHAVYGLNNDNQSVVVSNALI